MKKHSRLKLTYPLKKTVVFNRNLLFQGSIFKGYLKQPVFHGEFIGRSFPGWTDLCCQAFAGQSLPALEEADFEKDTWFGFVFSVIVDGLGSHGMKITMFHMFHGICFFGDVLLIHGIFTDPWL